MKTQVLVIVAVAMMSYGIPSRADTFTETNVKISYLTSSGFGPETKVEKFAGIKLDTKEALKAGCAWDVIAFDPSTEAGKKTFKELSSIAASKAPLKSIVFSKDQEGDCYLEKYEK